jgi:hypothetical protein
MVKGKVYGVQMKFETYTIKMYYNLMLYDFLKTF